jgi:predicted nucleic acid-binding protein
MSANIQRYCLDANVLIEPWNSYYSPKICPEYWKLLERLSHAGRIFIPKAVEEEIMRTEDQLAEWIKASGIPIYPIEEAVLSCLTKIYNTDPLHERLVDNIKGRSLADPWVIAHAMDQNACVVTKEKKQTARTDRIKIPNVCERMGIRCIDDFQLIEELRIKFSCILST